jgi:hypothetical protein
MPAPESEGHVLDAHAPLTLGPLHITPHDAAGPLEPVVAPLIAPGALPPGIELCDGGWLDEQGSYVLWCELTCADSVRMASISVDEADELRLVATPLDETCDASGETAASAEKNREVASGGAGAARSADGADGTGGAASAAGAAAGATPATPGLRHWRLATNPQSAGWKSAKPFSRTVGFARVRVKICLKEGGWHEYTTQDLAVFGRATPEHDHVRTMFEALLSPNNTASAWMFSTMASAPAVGSAAQGAVPAGTATTGDVTSLVHAMNAMEHTLDVAQAIEAPRAHRAVRASGNTGRRQTALLGSTRSSSAASAAAPAGNPTAPASDLAAQAAALAPENAPTVASILNRVAASARRLEAALAQDLRKGVACEQTLAALTRQAEAALKEHVSLPGYTMVSARLTREAAYQERLRDLITEATARAKTAGSERASAALVAAATSWAPFEALEVTREARALHATRPDKLYEYYTLWRILGWLERAGFAPDPAHQPALLTYDYSYAHTYAKFETDRAAHNTYHLRRGGETIALYYQPVLYGDAREENGLTLHRTVAAQPFDAGHTHPDAAWTPDMLLVHTPAPAAPVAEKRREGAAPARDATAPSASTPAAATTAPASHRFALDAKYRDLYELAGLTEEGVPDTSATTSEFTNQLRKYQTELMDAQGGRVDAVWLICGRGTRTTPLGCTQSEWGAGHTFESGLIPLSTQTDDTCLTALMAALGIAPRP